MCNVKFQVSSESDNTSELCWSYESSSDDDDVFFNDKIEMIYVADRDLNLKEETPEERNMRLAKIDSCQQIITLMSSKVPDATLKKKKNQDPKGITLELDAWVQAALKKSSEDVYTPLFDILNVDSPVKTKLMMMNGLQCKDEDEEVSNEELLIDFGEDEPMKLNQEADDDDDYSDPMQELEDDWEELKQEIEQTIFDKECDED